MSTTKHLFFHLWKRFNNCPHLTGEYSERPRSKLSDFGAFRFGSVVKSFRFQTTSENQTISFGFQTFSLTLKLGPNWTDCSVFGQPENNWLGTISKPVSNWFYTGLLSYFRIQNQFQTGLEPGLLCLEQILFGSFRFRMFGFKPNWTERSKTETFQLKSKGPNVWKPNMPKTQPFVVRLFKPNVRLSDIHCNLHLWPFLPKTTYAKLVRSVCLNLSNRTFEIGMEQTEPKSVPFTVQLTSKIRTFGIRTTPKSENFNVRTSLVRISNVRFIRRSDFGILYYRLGQLTEIWTKCSDFGVFMLFELI